MKKLNYIEITNLPGYAEWSSKFEKSNGGCALILNLTTKAFTLESQQRLTYPHESIVVDKF